MALNTCITLGRKKRKHRTVPLTMDVSPFDTNDNRAQRADQLHRRICQLQPFDRAIILLWLEDISYAETGQILGISANNVSVRLVRIRGQRHWRSMTMGNICKQKKQQLEKRK